MQDRPCTTIRADIMMISRFTRDAEPSAWVGPFVFPVVQHIGWECTGDLEFLRQLGCCSGEIIRFRITNDEESQIIAVRIFLGEALALSCTAASYLNVNSNSISLDISLYGSSGIPTASSVKLSRVRCPGSSGFDNYSTELSKYFDPSNQTECASEVIVWVGKVFGVCVGTQNVYFQVFDVDAKERLGVVSPSCTALETIGAVNCTVPWSFESSTLAQNLVNLIKPSLKHGLSMRVLLTGGRRTGKQISVRQVATRLGVHLLEKNSYDLLGYTEMHTSKELNELMKMAADNYPVIVHLRRFSALSQQTAAQNRPGDGLEGAFLELRDIFEHLRDSHCEVIFIASCENVSDVPLYVRSLFSHEVSVPPLEDFERVRLLSEHFDGSCLSKQMNGMSVGQIREIISETMLNSNLEQPCQLVTTCEKILNRVQKQFGEDSDAISTQIPNVRWEDIGGLASVKGEILDALELPMRQAALFGVAGVKSRAGLLLYGPPGTGKSLLAKAVATECDYNFISVKGPELLNMYVGESEANVRNVFEKARSVKPCVLFFDELDSLAPFRGNGSDSGGVMDRIVSQFLTELDGLSIDDTGMPEVLVIGATNRPDLLDPALLRPGRFDRCLYLGVSETHADQLKIIQALTRKFTLDDSVNLVELSEQCPFNFTGADLYALCSDAMLNSIKRKVDFVNAEVEAGMTVNDYLEANPEHQQVQVNMEDFLSALKSCTGSVSTSELMHYQKLRQQFSAPSQ